MIGLDTNVVLRYFLRDDSRQFTEAARLIDSAAEGGEPCLVDDIVLCEFAWVLHRVYGRTREEIADALESVLSIMNVQFERRELAKAAVAEYRHTAAGFADALIGQINRSLGAEYTASFDQNVKRLDTFRVL